MNLGSLLLPGCPFFFNSSHQQQLRCDKRNYMQIHGLKRDDHARGHGRDNYNLGKLVDENMIVLRERIHEMKMAEQRYEPPPGWMDWEKRYYAAGYDSDICEAVGLLQMLLMNMRPSLALGLLAVVALSVPTSMAALVSQLMEIAKHIG